MNSDKMNHFEEKRQQFGRVLRILTEFLEIILAVIILIGILLRFVDLPDQFRAVIDGDWHNFKTFLDFIIDSVIAVELVHLLCQPNLDSVVEILIVALTREIIMIDENPTGTLIYVIALGLVFALRRFMFVDKLDRHDKDFSLSSLMEHRAHKKREQKKEETDAAFEAAVEKAVAEKLAGKAGSQGVSAEKKDLIR